VAGQKRFVRSSERRRLAELAAIHPEHDRMHSELAGAIQRVAKLTTSVSDACISTHLTLTGDGGTRVHGHSRQPPRLSLNLAPQLDPLIQQISDARFGPDMGRLRATSTVRFEPTDDFHATQLRENPDDPTVYSNHGFYLHEVKNDLVAAELQLRKALSLDSKHVSANGNLANLLWQVGREAEAEYHYTRALEFKPGDELTTSNYVKFLLKQSNRDEQVRDILDQGIRANPRSGQLHLLRAEFRLCRRETKGALEDFRLARNCGAKQAAVEAGLACALHLSGGSSGECIAAYRVAIAIDGNNAALRLNLAQLLFLKGDGSEAIRELQAAMKLGLDPPSQLEAQFYVLAHTACEVESIVAGIKKLIEGGARLNWDVRPNIDAVGRGNPVRAKLLARVADVLSGNLESCGLDDIAAL
jgi:Flp pilus assembly protein TadD